MIYRRLPGARILDARFWMLDGYDVSDFLSGIENPASVAI
jgi:hypothetical protein